MIHNDMYGGMDGWLAGCLCLSVCLYSMYACMHGWMDGMDVMDVMLCNVM